MQNYDKLMVVLAVAALALGLALLKNIQYQYQRHSDVWVVKSVARYTRWLFLGYFLSLLGGLGLFYLVFHSAQ